MVVAVSVQMDAKHITANEIPLSIVAYNTKEEVMEWMLDIQLGRRNLSPIQRIAVAEKYRPIYERQAQQNLKEGGRKGGLANSSKPSQNSSKASNIENKIDVRAKLATVADVSTDTYSKGKKILDSDNETLKQEVLSGEKSINAGYKELTESNLRQRVLGNPNAMKLSRCIKEIERIYGVRNGSSNEKGNNRIGEPKVLADQSDVANMFGLSVDTLQNYKKLTELIPKFLVSYEY